MEEHKYKCPACLILTCGLKCVREHKNSSGCSGVKTKALPGSSSMALQNMTVDTLRGDMSMLELGINLSNRAKKENCLAKVGASMQLGIKPID